MSTSSTTWLDRAIGWMSPHAGLRRAQARTALLAVRAYEGASRGRRTDGWLSPNTSANVEIGAAAQTLRARSRDLARNNAWAAKALSVVANNVVGAGIMPTSLSKNRRVFKNYEAMWKDWGDTPECDAAEQQDFYGLQSLAIRTIVESGSCLVRRVWRRAADFPLKLQVLEPDHLDTTKDIVGNNGAQIIRGVEFDAAGRRVAYWLFPEHPGERVIFGRNALQSERVPADQVRHLYRIDRPGQQDGVPWISPAIIKLRDLDEYDDAQLVRQKIAACFAVFVKDSSGGLPLDAEKRRVLERVEPGAIEHLGPNKEVTFGQPPTVAGYNEFQRTQLLHVAAAYPITYEALTGDLSNVNFSSGRMGWLEFHRNVIRWQRDLMVAGMCQPTWDWFKEGAVLMGRPEADIGAKWTPPRREMLDPVKETQAIKDLIRCGLMSLSEAVATFGFDFEDVLEEIEASNKLLDEKGIVLDSDPRKVSGRGETAKEPAPKDPKEAEEERAVNERLLSLLTRAAENVAPKPHPARP